MQDPVRTRQQISLELSCPAQIYMLLLTMNKEQYFEMNDNSNVLNKDQIIKNSLNYFAEVMSEYEDRDMTSEASNVRDLYLVLDHLTDLDTLIERVTYLQSINEISVHSTIIEECIGSSH